MKKITTQLLLVLLVFSVVIYSCQKETEDISPAAFETTDEAELITYASGEVIEGQYIVIFNDDAFPAMQNRAISKENYVAAKEELKNEAKNLFKANKLDSKIIKHSYVKTMKGVAVELTDAEVEKLKTDSRVDYIEQDQIVRVTMGGPPGGGGGGGGGGGQQVPWGIARVNGGAGNTVNGDAWIIDSGIDLDHPDLNVDVGRSENFASGNSPNDGYGHGTHVAGTVGAIDNSIGVIGVAPGATVIAVRVLGNNGSGSTSGVIAGVDHVAANAGPNDVANMSLGGGYYQPLNDAVIAASNTCPFAIAAGNESTDANTKSPASAQGNNIYTVASMTSSDGWSSFSNYGVGNDPVDYIAPGSSILSTYKGGGYATQSGTSMASPHVCGILLLRSSPANGGTVSGPDGNYTVASN